jgi:P pilus assembly/Cpx signaling pathway, periplasmic inhibitor/zinc-resistance associated protein
MTHRRIPRIAAAGLATLALVAGALAVGTPLSAQDADALNEDPIFSTLFPPELIMQHRRAIELSDEQRDAISRLIQDLQGQVVRLQWELLDELQELGRVTGGTRVDLDRAQDQMNRVLDRERRIKQAHLEMLVRIKNLLSPEQQEQLQILREGAGSG